MAAVRPELNSVKEAEAAVPGKRRKVVGMGVEEKWREWEVGGGAKAASFFAGKLPAAAAALM